MSPRKSATREGGGRKAAAYIPIELYAEILYWLSCTEVLKMRLVCKDWLRLISNCEFMEKHLERSKAASGCNGTRILMPGIQTLTSQEEIFIHEYRYAEGSINMISKGEFPCSNDLRFLGSCDGLVLCKLNNKIALMNPCTRTMDSREPDALLSMHGILCSWFGHHPSTREYVLVLLRTDRGTRPLRLVFSVYSLSGTTSNSISVEELHGWEFFDSLQRVGTFLHGRLYFPVLKFNIDGGVEIFITGYEFESNVVFKMRAPTYRLFTLGVVEGCLTAIHHGAGMFEMWIMREHCWSKYANIEGNRSILTPIACFPNGDVVFEGDDQQFGTNKLSLYSLRDMESKHCEVYRACSCKSEGVACIESLVTPAMVWRGNQADYTHTITHQLGFYIK